jgi:hypothetical protein
MNAHVTPFNAESRSRREAALFNKPRIVQPLPAVLFHAFPSSNLNPVIDARPRW